MFLHFLTISERKESYLEDGGQYVSLKSLFLMTRNYYKFRRVKTSTPGLLSNINLQSSARAGSRQGGR